jgi:hypothetical protein
LKEENCEGHDPNTRQRAIGERRETTTDNICSQEMRSYTEIHNIVRALNGQGNIPFSHQQLKVDDKDDQSLQVTKR